MPPTLTAADQAFQTIRGSAGSRLPANNTSGYRGVSRDRHEHGPRCWRANVQVDGKRYFLGLFLSAEEAGGAVAEFRAAIEAVR